jgi:Zn-finger protein
MAIGIVSLLEDGESTQALTAAVDCEHIDCHGNGGNDCFDCHCDCYDCVDSDE